MNVLVTGGAGFIGSHLVDRLVADGHDVSILDDLSTGKRQNLHPRAKFHHADLRDAPAIAELLRKIRPTVVMHHAAQTDVRRSMRDPASDAAVNVVGFVGLLDACVRVGVEKVTFASTSAVYPDPDRVPLCESDPAAPMSAYGMSKLAGERYLDFFQRVHGLRYTAFRYGNVYGPRQDPKGECGVVGIFALQLLTGAPSVIFGDGRSTRDYVHVADVVEANMRAIERGDGKVLNIGRGVETPVLEIFEEVRRAVGVDAKPRFEPKRPGEVERISLDSTLARGALGWEPRVGLREGIERSVEYYRGTLGGTSP